MAKRRYEIVLNLAFEIEPEPESAAAQSTAAEDAPKVAEILASELQDVMRDNGFPGSTITVADADGSEVAE